MDFYADLKGKYNYIKINYWVTQLSPLKQIYVHAHVVFNLQSRGLKDLTQRVEFLQIDDDCLR
jgi:hypothetical protein